MTELKCNVLRPAWRAEKTDNFESKFDSGPTNLHIKA